VGLVHEVVGARLYPDGPAHFGGAVGWHGAGLLCMALGLVMAAGALGVITVRLVPLAAVAIVAGAVNVLGDAVLHGGFHFFAFTLLVAGAVVAVSAARPGGMRSRGSG
jgi:ethanolamine utilization microcompartment shell protein EutS